MKNNTYEEYRGLSSACFQMLESISGLRALLEHVCKDPTCCVEVRHNYLNCYYRGGSLFKMEFKPMLKQLEFKFAPKYFKLKHTSCAAHGTLEAWIAAGPNDPKEWRDRLDELKQVMDAWMSEHPKAEREIQQKIIKLNTFAHGNYQSIDIELAIPKNRKSGRMDIIAVRQEGKQYVPVIVELKHGTGAFRGKSGIREHYDKTTHFLDCENGDPYLIETIRQIWTAKRKLGLLEEPVPDASAFKPAELLFAVTGWPEGNTGTIRELLPEKLNRTVYVATSPTEDLYFNRGVSLDLHS